MCAPMSRSGAATRSIGRRMSEASPISVESNACAGKKPHEKPHRRAGVSHIERLGGSTQRLAPAAVDVDDIRSRSIDSYTE